MTRTRIRRLSPALEGLEGRNLTTSLAGVAPQGAATTAQVLPHIEQEDLRRGLHGPDPAPGGTSNIIAILIGL